MQDAVIPHLDTSMNFFKLSLIEADSGNNIIYSVKKEKKIRSCIKLKISSHSITVLKKSG